RTACALYCLRIRGCGMSWTRTPGMRFSGFRVFLPGLGVRRRPLQRPRSGSAEWRTLRVMSKRSSVVGLALALALSLGASSAGGQAAHFARAGRPSDLLPKPPSCAAKNAKPEFCVLSTPFGTLTITPHIVRPGHVVTARIASFNCNNVPPVPGQCPVNWPVTGVGHCIPGSSGSALCTVEAWMKRISRCGPQDHVCSWRVSKHAPTTRYGLLGVSISRGGALAEDVGETSDYLGILG